MGPLYSNKHRSAVAVTDNSECNHCIPRHSAEVTTVVQHIFGHVYDKENKWWRRAEGDDEDDGDGDGEIYSPSDTDYSKAAVDQSDQVAGHCSWQDESE